MAEEIVRIGALGHQGDGVVEGEPGLFVPYVLPGERVRIERGEKGHAALKGIVEPSPERVKAPCPHFTRCGGCALQHVEEEAYAEWKRGLVVEALRLQNIEAEVEPLIRAQPRSRRRAAFSFSLFMSGAA